MTPLIDVRSVSKRFSRATSARQPTFRAWVESGFRPRPRADFWALRDVSFSVNPSEFLAVVGRNGSGKSTLLRLLGGVMRPDGGTVGLAARPNGILELNAGTHPDLTGRENAVISGVLSGLSRRQVLARMDAIIAFSELGPAIDQPVRTYSSGMKLRLGFSVAVHADPRILLIDEVLAVGDLAFQEKCLARIREFRAAGCAIVLVTHDLHQARSMADRVLWMDKGKVRALGAPETTVAQYEAESHAQIGSAVRQPDDDGANLGLRMGDNRLGSFEATISDVAFEPRITVGSPLSISFTVTPHSDLPKPHVSVSIEDKHGTLCFDANSQTDSVDLPELSSARRIVLDLERLDLAPGTYRVSVGIWAGDWSTAHDYHINAYPLEVDNAQQLEGFMSPPRRWRISD